LTFAGEANLVNVSNNALFNCLQAGPATSLSTATPKVRLLFSTLQFL